MFACWFQLGLIRQPTVFSSHNKPAPAGLISPETNQRTGRLSDVVIVLVFSELMVLSAIKRLLQSRRPSDDYIAGVQGFLKFAYIGKRSDARYDVHVECLGLYKLYYCFSN